MKLSLNLLRTSLSQLFAQRPVRRSRRPSGMRVRSRYFFEPLECRRLLVSDLAITKTDAPDPATPGGTLTYTIQVTNTGPDPATATVADTFPAGFTGVVFTSTATGGATGNTASGTGSINNAVTLPVGSTITYTVTGTVSATATGTLTNTATVTPTGTTTDPNTANNSDTETTAITPQADLSVVKTNGGTTVTPGGATSYVIVVSNSGPTTVTGATITDAFPAALQNVSYTTTTTGGVSGVPTGTRTGNIADTVTLPAGSTVTYTVTATISPTATGTISNTATVSAPAGVTEITEVNNTSTDTDTVVTVAPLTADLSITKTNGVTRVAPGSVVTYVIEVRNAGPGAVTGATVADVFPPTLTGVTFTATGTGGASAFDTSGAGPIADTVNLPAGATVTYTVTGTVSPTAAGAISNTATVSGPVVDANAANNVATDTDLVVRPIPGVGVADLSVTKTDNATTVEAGGTVTYTVVVSNAGPSAANGAIVTDVFPPTLTGVTFTASGTGGASAFDTSGSGNINDTVNLPAGSTITYIVTGQASPTATGTVSNTVSVTPPANVLDVDASDNVATDTTTITPGGQVQTDVSVNKTNGAGPVAAGDLLTYTITVSNLSTTAAQNVTLSDAIPANTTFVSATQTSGPAFTTTTPTAGGTGAFVATTPTLAAGSSATFQLVVQVDDDAGGATVTNSATVTTTTAETTLTNNTDTVATDVEGGFPGGGDLECVVETANFPGAPGTISLEDDLDNPGAGALIITGTSRADVIVIIPRGSDQIRVLRNGRNVGDFDRDAVQHIVVFAGGGNDVVVVNASLDIDATLFGEAGNDKLFGGAGDDGIDGGTGNDHLFGLGGDDTICGDAGNDFIYGHHGDDFLGGDAGNDHVFGHAGDDVVLGNAGNDKVFGGIGDDFVHGQEGNDFVFGEPGNDVLLGGAGNDSLFGGSGNDLLIGGDGRDKLFGEAGDDILVGGSTGFDEDLFALAAIGAELNAGGDLDTRIENIRTGGGETEGFALDDSSVFDDGAVDDLWGGPGDDWFIVGPRDRIRDRRSNDRVN